MATVLTEPATSPADTAKDRFYLKSEEFSEPEPRVDLRIDRVLAGRLRKEELLQHDGLSDLSVIRAPTGTNFAVSPEERAALDELLAVDKGGNEGDVQDLDPKWKRALELCRLILQDRPRFDRDEIDYKKEVAKNIQIVFAAASAGEPLVPAIKVALGHPNNLLHFLQMASFKEWLDENEDDARQAILALEQPETLPERVDGFLELIPSEVLKSPGAKMAFASFFLMGLDSSTWPHYRAEPIKTVEKLLGWPAPPDGVSLGTEYEHHVAFVREFLERVQAAGLAARDMLEAQSLIWILAKRQDKPFKEWRGEEVVVEVTQELTTIDALTASLFLDKGFLEEVLDLLKSKRQLIFYGPPGTGKTYIARKLTAFLTGADPERSAIVQFHPSYSYEDFVQGYRPSADAKGTLSYKLVAGPLVRLAEAARQAPVTDTHVLLVDEINRGNLPRIFGELLYLLEYRDEEVVLMYSEEGRPFTLPENLWIIGTMNTADRSIGLIDAALRRRFHFVPLFPGERPIGQVLEKWLAKNAPGMEKVSGYVDTLNARLRQRFGAHLQVGHSYFMVPGLDDQALGRIWRADIMPFLEDQLFGKETELADFQLDKIKSGLVPGQSDDQPVGQLSDLEKDLDGDADDQAEGI